jgi:hypothetical protein
MNEGEEQISNIYQFLSHTPEERQAQMIAQIELYTHKMIDGHNEVCMCCVVLYCVVLCVVLCCCN